MQQSQLFDFFGFARANKHGCIGRFAFAGESSHRVQTSGLRQLGQFIEFGVEMRQTKVNAYQQGCGRRSVVSVRQVSEAAAFKLVLQAYRPGQSSRDVRGRWWKSRVCRPSV